MGYQCGGPAATGVATASKMGASTAFLGSFTDDDYAEAMIADFKKYNVDTSCIARKKGYSSGSAVIINSADTASRTIVWTKGNVPETAPDDIDTEAIKKAKMLYLDGNHINASLYACKIAKENGVKVFVDARITSYNVCYTKLLRSILTSRPPPYVVVVSHVIFSNA